MSIKLGTQSLLSISALAIALSASIFSGFSYWHFSSQLQANKTEHEFFSHQVSEISPVKVEEKLKTLTESDQFFNDELYTTKENVKQVQGQVSNLQAEVKRLQQEVGQYKTEISRLEAENQTLTSCVSDYSEMGKAASLLAGEVGNVNLGPDGLGVNLGGVLRQGPQFLATVTHLNESWNHSEGTCKQAQELIAHHSTQ